MTYYEAQRRYDIAYVQCMYARGNQVPGRTAYRAPPPPGSAPAYPPPNYPPPQIAPGYGSAPTPAPARRRAGELSAAQHSAAVAVPIRGPAVDELSAAGYQPPPPGLAPFRG